MLRPHVAPMVDEVGLLARAAEEVRGFGGSVPNREMLQALTQERGIDLATAIFYQSILASPLHGPFVRAVEAETAAPLPSPSRFHLLIVPALYYQELPQYGGDGQAIAAIAQACGMRVTVAPLLSKGSLSDNAAILWETLCRLEREKTIEGKTDGEEVLLLSLSVGGGEVRILFAEHAGDPRLERLAGWINICGLVRGIPLAAQLLRNPLRRLHAKTICKVIGIDFGLVRELDPDHAFWQGTLALPPKLRVLNLIGVPLHSHVQQRSLFKRYAWMQALGPNDGMSLLSDLIVEPGLIYPLWGADHYFRTPQVSPLLYRLFRFLRQEWAGEVARELVV
ncbi:MAG: hypothetical protein IT328_18900 [Caldilineaceae bacterium]|nr:hypothetical protein [Caldilineaceae bacterium]